MKKVSLCFVLAPSKGIISQLQPLSAFRSFSFQLLQCFSCVKDSFPHPYFCSAKWTAAENISFPFLPSISSSYLPTQLSFSSLPPFFTPMPSPPLLSFSSSLMLSLSI
jgi:hypothetical protein